ncbi:uncharacterized protein LOC127255473 [Andrographis paniculata]|uniref:uncharacterized protein LOC127255473 n=1 Tax=Andrographis paniculata TaxID=175694 RepID=UPI0021E90C6D|nr:uncharacterized protein LOC127255473 [Andrographis paniculata]
MQSCRGPRHLLLLAHLSLLPPAVATLTSLIATTKAFMLNCCGFQIILKRLHVYSVRLCSINKNILYVGKELFEEKLPLQNGDCVYQLRKLKPHTWYEVKISYPASIPASLSLQLMKGASDLELNQGRKLLNTEKLIFKTVNDRVRMSVLVNVKPEGVVAIPGKQEREYIMFNIVCDELLLGIPHKAWHVVGLLLACLLLAFVVPSFLPSLLLPQNGNHLTFTKES